MNKEEIKQLQRFDSLSEAENITGKPHHNDDDTVFLGMAMQMNHSENMARIMEATDDTKFSETIEEYLRKVTDFGFKVVLKEEFKSDGNIDFLYIMWHDKYSILLAFDTFRGSRNGGHIYYNWSPNGYDRVNHSLLSSGGFEGFYWNADFTNQIPNPLKQPLWRDGETPEQFNERYDVWNVRDRIYRSEHNLKSVWVGNHDCREAIKNNIGLMADNGVFLKKWIKRPFLWLLHHEDNTDNYEAINAKRIARLPEYIQKAIS